MTGLPAGSSEERAQLIMFGKSPPSLEGCHVGKKRWGGGGGGGVGSGLRREGS